MPDLISRLKLGVGCFTSGVSVVWAYGQSFDWGLLATGITGVFGAVAGGIVILASSRKKSATTDREIREEAAASALKIREAQAAAEIKIRADAAAAEIKIRADAERARLEMELERDTKLRPLISRQLRETLDKLADAEFDRAELHKLVAKLSGTADRIEEKVGKPKILIVEDDDHARQTLAKLFQLKAYDVTEAKDHDEAMKLLAEVTFAESLAFVALDLMLPGGPGLNILKHIKKQGLPCHVVVMTGMAEGEILKEADRRFADIIVRKPIGDFDKLFRQMELLKHKSPRPSTADVDMATLTGSSDVISTTERILP